MGNGEYHHFVQTALDAKGLHLQTVDVDGVVRERFSRPLAGQRPIGEPHADGIRRTTASMRRGTRAHDARRQIG